jgi:hypothetical protein
MRILAAPLAIAATLAAASQASAQVVPPPQPSSEVRAAAPRSPEQADSARLVRRSRSEQAGFERYRAHRAPGTFRGGGGSRCDERIGRYCMWFGRDTTYEPGDEPGVVAARRQRLLTALDSAAAALPGDPWIASQRVRYAVESDETGRALSAARECRAEGWWCGALEGFALHFHGDFPAAEAAFDAVLAAMDDDDRRRWTELSMVLPDGEHRAYRRLQPEEKAAFERRFWWLADPFWTVPGNDRRTEHLARWVMDGMQERARTTEGNRWGADLREILLRYGIPVGHERTISTGMALRPGGLITYYPTRSWEFLPPAEAVEVPEAIAADGWRLELERTRTSYAPVYAARFVDLPHQVARFRRGSDGVLVAAYAVPEALAADPDARFRAGAVWYDAEGERRAEALHPAGPNATAFRLDVPRAPGVVSIELLEMEGRSAARARFGVEMPQVEGLALSDVLLLADPDARPASLPAAAAAARGATTVRPGERLALYWEIYGVPEEAREVTVQVTLSPGRAGWARRRLEALGLAAAGAPVRMRWDEAVAAVEVVPRSMAVQLPEDTRPGDYTLEMGVRVPGHGTVTAERVVTVGP